MKLTLLGTGGAVPYENKNACSYLLQTQNEDILIDAGFGVSTQYRKVFTDINRLNHIFLTHMHMDHTCELAMIMFWAYLIQKKEDFVIHGPVGNVSRFVDGLFNNAYYFINDMAQEARQRNFDYSVDELALSDRREIDGAVIENIKVDHFTNFPCVAYKITTQNSKVVISGDTTLCPGVIDICRDADVLILDVNMHEAFGHNVFHLIPSEVNTILEQSSARRVYITHQGPNLKGKEKETMSIIQEANPGLEVIWAEDMMVINI